MLYRNSLRAINSNLASRLTKNVPNTNCFNVRTMATATQVKVTPETSGIYSTGKLGQDAASKTSELLQKNHEEHHIFFNDDGFHNHIVHHLLTIYALSASPSEIKSAYKHNAGYQRLPLPINDNLPIDLADPSIFHKCLGQEKHYPDFLAFFAREIDAKGYPAVLNEFLFKGDERADDMLTRHLAGFLHPIIHTGYGIEFAQPAIIAEGLAQTAVHKTWMEPFLVGSEKVARSSPPCSHTTLYDLGLAARADPLLAGSAKFSDSNKIRDGILVRAPDAMNALAAKWTVTPDTLEERTAEMVFFAAYMTAAAQRPDKAVKMDFFYMHAINTCPMLGAILKADWLGVEQKCRLLEWKGRGDLALYVSRGVPELRRGEVEGYKPLKGGEKGRSWKELAGDVNKLEDDGHVSKFIRALAYGENLGKKWDGKEWALLKVDEWRVVANMVLDSVEGAQSVWVRNTGFDEAWKDIPDR